MTESVFDFKAIAARLGVMHGENRSGTMYRQNDDGTNEVVSKHELDVWGNECTRCGFTRIELEDNLAPIKCPGVKPKGAERFCIVRGVEYWRHPDGSRFVRATSKGSREHLQQFREWRQYGQAGKPKATNYHAGKETYKLDIGLGEPSDYQPYKSNIEPAAETARVAEHNEMLNKAMRQVKAHMFYTDRPPIKRCSYSEYVNYVNGEPEPHPGAFKKIETEYDCAFRSVGNAPCTITLPPTMKGVSVSIENKSNRSITVQGATQTQVVAPIPHRLQCDCADCAFEQMHAKVFNDVEIP